MTEQEPRETGAVWALIQEWMDAQRYPPSQAKLAERIDVSPSSVSDWKYRESMPGPGPMRRLASELGIRYERVLDAFLADHDYLMERPSKAPGREVTGT